jgi:hypothetical protein
MDQFIRHVEHPHGGREAEVIKSHVQTESSYLSHHWLSNILTAEHNFKIYKLKNTLNILIYSKE